MKARTIDQAVRLRNEDCVLDRLSVAHYSGSVAGRHINCGLFVVLLLCVSMLTVSCSPARTSVQPPLVTPPPGPTLRSLAQARGISIGAAVNVDALRNDANYRQLLGDEFNMVTPENAMKFEQTEPEQGIYTFADADSIVAFAKAHRMQVRGHNLVWHANLPDWLTRGHFSRSQLMTILREHITTVVSHYRGQVNIWDVVNEGVDDSGKLRNSIWLQALGPNYINLAFRWAHEANPSAKLFYNDYDGEGLGRKSNAIYNLVKGLLQRHVPISGVGLQMHVSLADAPTQADVIANMKRLAALGLEVQITEMDVAVGSDARPMSARLAAQARIYAAMLQACLSVRACTAFVMWGFTDRYTWIPEVTGLPDAPLPFDANYHPKPAYAALVDTFKGTSLPAATSWRMPASGFTNSLSLSQ